MLGFGLAKKAVLLGVGAVLLYFGVTFVQVFTASRTNDVQRVGAIVVLGAAQYDGEPSPVFRARLDHAATLFQNGMAPVVVVTGGRQEGDRLSEGQAGYGYLIGQGIPESALRLENAGANSWESLAAASRFLRDEGVTDVLLVSSPYHAMRIQQIAAELGLTGYVSSTRTSPEGFGSQLAHLGRETVAVGVGRIIGYGRLVRLDEGVGRVRDASGTG
jgi:uncharacterized SAM-binding protein YcdF (DUF218 family)